MSTMTNRASPLSDETGVTSLRTTPLAGPQALKPTVCSMVTIPIVLTPSDMPSSNENSSHTIDDPNSLDTLNDYLCAIYSNTVGHNLQWLFSSPTLIEDNVCEHLNLTRLYSQIDHQNGRIYHTQKGLRITIPED